MSRNVPGAQQAHLDQVGTTTCRLLKITTKVGDVFGMTTLDRDVSYDDGTDDVVYKATNGFDPTAIVEDLGFTVGNGEGFALLADGVGGVTDEMVRAGELDDGVWVCYQVNYEDLSQGHVMLGFGDLGEVRPVRGALQWVMEMLSLVVRLKQPIGTVTSRTCRATYGTPANSQTGCGVDVTGMWVEGVVQEVGVEPDRTFSGDEVCDLPEAGYPARLQFLSGANSGRTFAVETIDGLVVSLLEATPYPIEEGDEYRVRQDCRKRFKEDCIEINDNRLKFKGEPYTPVGDGAAAQVPGAELPSAGGPWFKLVSHVKDQG